jgi:hypothetical protein
VASMRRDPIEADVHRPDSDVVVYNPGAWRDEAEPRYSAVRAMGLCVCLICGAVIYTKAIPLHDIWHAQQEGR